MDRHCRPVHSGREVVSILVIRPDSVPRVRPPVEPDVTPAPKRSGDGQPPVIFGAIVGTFGGDVHMQYGGGIFLFHESRPVIVVFSQEPLEDPVMPYLDDELPPPARAAP